MLEISEGDFQYLITPRADGGYMCIRRMLDGSKGVDPFQPPDEMNSLAEVPESVQKRFVEFVKEKSVKALH
jgi:hypothetical protein